VQEVAHGDAASVLQSDGQQPADDEEKAIRFDGSLQPSNRAEKLEGRQNEAIVAAVIQIDIPQVEFCQRPGPETAQVFIAHIPLGSLLFSRLLIFIRRVLLFKPSSAQLFRGSASPFRVVECVGSILAILKSRQIM
jgi:hypothetical protein